MKLIKAIDIPDAPDCSKCGQVYRCIDGDAFCIAFLMTPLEVVNKNYIVPCAACMAARLEVKR